MGALKYMYIIFIICVVAAIVVGAAIYAKIQIRKYRDSYYSLGKDEIIVNVGLVMAVVAVVAFCIIKISLYFY